MVTREKAWVAGTPCWVDLTVSDLDRARAFYTEVLGWSYTPSDPDLGGYCNALLDGRQVCGLSPAMPGMDAAHVWTVYLATDDIQATQRAAQAAGAAALVEPMEIPSLGWMGVWADPVGSAFGAWQALRHTGFTVANEDGAVAWCDLMTADPAGARDFYAELFGYRYQDIGLDGPPYALFTPPGAQRPAGGIGAAPAGPGQPPAGWSVCFQVQDVDAAAARVTAAGGQLLQAAHDFDYGRLVTASGMDGEAFALMTPKAAS